MADIQLIVHGVDELSDAFDAFLRDLLLESREGFVPEAQYRGAGGVPFTLDTIDYVTKANGLELG